MAEKYGSARKRCVFEMLGWIQKKKTSRASTTDHLHRDVFAVTVGVHVRPGLHHCLDHGLAPVGTGTGRSFSSDATTAGINGGVNTAAAAAVELEVLGVDEGGLGQDDTVFHVPKNPV